MPLQPPNPRFLAQAPKPAGPVDRDAAAPEPPSGLPLGWRVRAGIGGLMMLLAGISIGPDLVG